MAVKDLVQQAKNSRLGKAISNLTSGARTVAQPYAQSFSQSAQQMGSGVGGAIRAPFDMYFNSRNAQIDNSVADTLRSQEQRFMSQGNYSAARDRSQLIAGIQERIADRQITMGQQMNKDRTDAALGTAGTALQLFGAKGIGVGGFAGATAVTGGLGYGITRAMGGSNDEALAAAGTGAGKALQYRGINKVSDKFFTNPLMSRLGQQGNMPVRVGFGAGVNAFANIGEDEVLTRVNEGRAPTTQERVTSGAAGAVMGGFSQGVATRQYTKQIEENQRQLVNLADQAVKNNKADKALKKSINDYMNNYDEPVSKLKRKIGIQPASVIERMYNDLKKTGKVNEADVADVRKFWESYASSPKLAYHMTNEEIVTDLHRHARGTLSQGGFVGKIDDTGKLQFDGNYQRGDIKTLQTRLDELLGTKSFNFSGKWQAELPARQLAVRQIESYAEQGDVDAVKYLSEIRSIEDQLANAQIAKTQAKGTSQTGIQEGTPLKSLQPETGKSSRTKIATQETQNPKLQTFRGEPIEPTGVKILTKKAEKVKAVSDASSKISISRDKKYAFNINKQKLQLDEAQSKELDAVVEVMRPVLEENKGKTLTKQEIITGGRKAQVLVEVVGRDEAKQFSESLQASRNLLRSEQAQIGITPKFLEQLEVVSSVAADAGRRLQAFNIGAEDITIKEMLLQDILKTGASLEDILKAGKEVDWNNAKEITDFYRKFKPATLADKLAEFRYTNMLSSPNTHINNAFSNFLQTAILAPVEKTVRGSVDFAQSKLTGKEQEYFARQGVDYARGYWKALPEAFGNFKKTLAGNEGLTSKPDIEFIPTSTSKLRQIYTFPLQALEASDQFFRTLVKGGEIESLKTEGITGAKASKIAEQQADYRTFRQAFDPDGKLGQNGVLKMWDKWNVAINRLRNVPGGKWLVPFLQTPTNILKQGFEYSPLGFTTVRGSGEPATQMAKAIIGSTVFTGAYAMASSGLTTWDTPTNATEKAEFYAAGLQPYSMKIGGTWVSYSKLGPLAYPIAMASALKWAQDNGGDDDALTTMGSAFSGTLGFFADQSYVRGIGDIIDALRGDEYKQARGLSNIPAQMIPYRSFMGWVARQVDIVRRKSSGGKVPEQIGKSIVSQIPFASKSLEAHQTPFGEESLRQFPTINAYSPFSISKEKPKEKEYYDARQKLRKQKKEVNKVLDKIEAGEDIKINTDGMLAKQVASLTKKKVEAGIEVTQQELETTYLNNTLSMPQSNRYEKSQRDSGLYSSLSTIDNNEYLTEQQKTDLKGKVALELGKTPQDLQIYSVAKGDNDSKTMYAYDQIDKSTSFDDTMSYLVNGRKPINGQILVSDGVINNLVADGVIPYALGKDIKEIDLNEDGTRRGTVKSRRGGRSGSKKSNAAQLKAFNDLGEDLKKIKIGTSKIRTTQSQRINTKGLTFSGA